MRAVLDQDGAVLVSDLRDLVDSARHAVQVGRDHDAGLGGDRPTQGLRIHSEGLGLAVGESQTKPEGLRQVRHHGVAEGRTDHLGARLEAQRFEDETQAGTPGRNGDRVGYTGELGEVLFELGNLVTVPEIPAKRTGEGPRPTPGRQVDTLSGKGQLSPHSMYNHEPALLHMDCGQPRRPR